MSTKLKYVTTSFTGMVVIFFSGIYAIDNFEGTSVASVLALVSSIVAIMFGWAVLMAKLFLK